jgi:hypothetical protein
MAATCLARPLYPRYLTQLLRCREFPHCAIGRNRYRDSPVRLSRGSEEGSAAGARGVERSETTRAPAGDGPNGAIFRDRADSPGATSVSQRPNLFGERLQRTCAPVKRP